MPFGSKFFVTAEAVPQYIWYDQLMDRRTWGGDYRASILALGNRLSGSLGGSYSKGSAILNSETQQTVIQTTKNFAGNLEIGLTRAISFVAGAEFQNVRNSDQGLDPSLPADADVHHLDRTDGAALGGLRWNLSPSVGVSAGAQVTRSDFVEDPEVRNNETIAYLAGFHYDRPDFFVNLTGGYRKGQPSPGSSFPEYATGIGSYYVSWNFSQPAELQAYGHRHPIFSRSAFDLLYVETRYGGALQLKLGPRVSIRGYAEFGTNSYPFRFFGTGASTKRVDDSVQYGGDVSLQVVSSVVVRAHVYQINITSNEPGIADRKIFRFYTGLSLFEELTR